MSSPSLQGLSLSSTQEPERVFPKQKFAAALQESHCTLTADQVEAVQLFYEHHLNKYMNHENRIVCGTKFTHNNKTYTLPRTIEVVTDPVTHRKMAFLALNKGMSTRTNAEERHVIRLYQNHFVEQVARAGVQRVEAGTTFIHDEESYTLPKPLQIREHEGALPTADIVPYNSHTQKDWLVGLGSFKRVKCGVHLDDGEVWARYTVEDDQEARAELAFAQKHGHEVGLPVGGVIHFTSSHCTDPAGQTLAQVPKKIAVYQQLCRDGNLEEALEKGVFQQLTEPDTLYLMESALKGMAYLHGQRLVHRDLKGKNTLLVKENGRLAARIIDVAQCHAPGEQNPSTGGSRLGGTCMFRSPELLHLSQRDIHTIDYAQDLWAMGLTLYPIFYGQEAPNREYLAAGKAHDTAKMRQIMEARKQAGEESLIDKSMVPRTPGGKMDENSVQYVLWSLLQFDPVKRKGLSAAQAHEKIQAKRVAAEGGGAKREENKAQVKLNASSPVTEADSALLDSSEKLPLGRDYSEEDEPVLSLHPEKPDNAKGKIFLEKRSNASDS